LDAGENTINSNEKQDVMIYIRFVRGHWKIYIVAVLLTVVVSMIYGLFFNSLEEAGCENSYVFLGLK